MQRTACFVCTTPYQMLGAIAIVQEFKIDSDLYVFDCFHGCRDIIVKLRNYDIFNSVVVIDYEQFESLKIKDLIYQDLNYTKIVRPYISQEIVYDYFYATTRAHFVLLIQYTLKKRNPQMKCVYYDDGTGSYTFDSPINSALVKKKHRDLIEFVMGQNSMDKRYTSIMVSLPELVELPSKWSSIHINRMPTFSFSKTNRDMLMNVFSVSEADIIKEKVILFDTYRRPDLISTSGICGITECYKEIIRLLGKNNVVCKAHPRSTCKIDEGIKEYSKPGIPVEVLYSSMNDLEDKILVANLSTALFSPKLLYGKEPFIVTIHRIMAPEDKEIENIYEKMYSLYYNKNKIFAPQTNEELKKVILNLL